MLELVNPYLLGRTPRTFGGARAAAVALVGVAVVGGCGSTDKVAPPAAPPPTAGPTTAPAPTPAPPTPAPGATAPKPAPENAQPTPDGQYTVRRGDTLSGLAVRFNVKGGWPVLFKRNARVVRDPDLILVGQKLQITGP